MFILCEDERHVLEAILPLQYAEDNIPLIYTSYLSHEGSVFVECVAGRSYICVRKARRTHSRYLEKHLTS
jgi:hypothetical protein